MKVALVSLGCSRTLVDSEVALGGLAAHGYQIVPKVSQADIAIVNTCGFIEEAKAESIETILELCERKKRGKLAAVVVLGCLAQRYGQEIRQEITEADAIIGTNSYGDLAAVLEPLKKSAKVFQVEPKPYYLLDENTPRYTLTPSHLAYVKISEGCINACSYCVIPKMKGAHRSRSIESILREIEAMEKSRSISEINLIGQDTAAYGYDVDKTFHLARLLREVSKHAKAPWIRLLYAHPGHLTEEMIDVIGSSKNICHYVDFPIEHSHDEMLLRMNRQVTRERMEWGIRQMRKRISGVSIRTTIIVGFPGETEEEFKDLMDFLESVKFDKLGVFQFSPEEGSRAVNLPNPVADELKKERYHMVMDLQRQISDDIHKKMIGEKMTVLIEEKSADTPSVYLGRTERDASEVDGAVYLHSKKKLKRGEFVQAVITRSSEYDLEAELAQSPE